MTPSWIALAALNLSSAMLNGYNALGGRGSLSLVVCVVCGVTGLACIYKGVAEARGG